jgi:ubiquinone/menaquinone biosynthesis C-methylase UbiE
LTKSSCFFFFLFPFHIFLNYQLSAQADTVLEIGCGGGGSAKIAQTLFMKKDSKLVLMDLSPEMIKLAQQTME